MQNILIAQRATPQKLTAWTWIIWTVLCVYAEQAHARPNIRQAFFDAYPGAVGSRLDSTPSHPGHCGVCHYDFNGGGLRNPYGQALLDSGFSLNTDAGRSNAIWSVRLMDMDNDGFTTDVEVTNRAYANTPTFPGLNSSNVALVLNVPLGEVQNYVTRPPGVTLLLRRYRC